MSTINAIKGYGSVSRYISFAKQWEINKNKHKKPLWGFNVFSIKFISCSLSFLIAKLFQPRYKHKG